MHRHSIPAARTLKVKTLAVAIAASFATSALANPVGPNVAAGNATFATSGNTLTVVNTPGTIINWQQFNIGQNEITRFMQQSNQSTVLNRITGQDPSQILGTLQSNGRVFLVNPNGILFGQNAVIDVFGLVASNLNLANADFLAGRFSFNGGGAGAVVNQGAITTPVGGTVYLIGSSVANQGLITSPKGEVLLAAGNSVSLADTGTPNLSVTLNAAGNKAVNVGRITADGGRIDIYGALIDQQGVLRADSASLDEQGRVVLKATQGTTVGGEISAANSAGNGGTVHVLGDDVALASSARIDASGATGGGTVLVGGDLQGKNAAVQNATTTRVAAGATIKADATDKGNGGKVVVWSDDKTFFDGLIYARGGANGGDGGFVETSGHTIRVGGMVNTTAPKGKAGTWLLDPAIGCVADDLALCPAGAEMTTTSYVEQALALNANLEYTASDYFKFVTAQPWVVSATAPATGKISISAPYIVLNGSVNAVTNGKSIDFNMMAYGTSATYPTSSGVIMVPAGGKELRTLGQVMLNASKTVEIAADAHFQTRHLSISAGDYFSFVGNAGSQAFLGTSGPSEVYISAPYVSLGGTIPVAFEGSFHAYAYGPLSSSTGSATYPTKTGTMDVNATFIGSLGSSPSSTTRASYLWLSAPTINGAVVFSQFSSGSGGYYGYVGIETDKLNATIAGTVDQFSARSNWIWNSGPITAKPLYIGTAGSDPVCATALCINTQLAQVSAKGLQFGGGYGWSSSSGVVTVGYGGDVYYNGAPSLASAPTSIGIGGPKVVINSPVTGTQFVHVEAYDSFTNNVGPNAFGGVQYELLVAPNPVLNGLTPTVMSTPYPAYPCDAPGYPSCTTKTAAYEAYNAEVAGKNYASYRLAYVDKTGGAVPPPTPVITFSGNYSGTFSGSLSGTWTLNVSSTGAITGTARNSDGTVVSLSGTAAANGNLSFANGGASTGEHFTGTYNASTGVLSGTWSNSATGASGQFTNQAPAPAPAPAVTTDTVTQQTVAKAVTDTCTTNAALCTSSTQQQATASAVAAETGSGAKGKLTVDEKLKKAEDKKVEDKKVAEDKKQPEDKKQAEQKKVEVAKQKQEAKAAEERKSPAELKQEAKQAQAEAKKVEAEAKKVEAEAKTVEAEAKQASTAAKKAEPEAKKAEAEAKKAEAEIKTAKTPERKAAAEAKKAEAEAKVAEVEAKKGEADAKQAQAASKKVEAEAKKAAHDAKEAEAEHKLALAEAKEAKTPQAKAEAQGKAAEKQVEATRKKAEGEVKQAKAEEHKVEAAQKKAETEAKQAEHSAKEAEAGAKKAEADAARAKQAGKPDEEKKALAQKAEHEKKVEAHQKQAEAKQAEASARKAEQRKMAEERRSQAAKAFGSAVVAAVMPEKLAEMAALRHEYKTEVLKPALTILEQNPKAADMPACGAGGGDVCVPVKAAVAEAAKQPAAQLVSALPKPTLAFVPQIERKVAVLVGINNYADKNIPSLESAVPDVEAVGKMMAEKLGYEVRVVRDATKADIVKAINGVGREVGPNDSVAIYYAGHGYLSEKTNTGYWIPADSSAQSPANWISNDDIARLLQQVPAKQVMLVSDSCYSGSLTREGKVGAGGGVEDILGKRSVTVMSSGGEEPVSDEGKDGHSIFAWSLMDSLKKLDRVEPGAKLFDQVKRGVVEEYPQVPQYGAATSAGHSSGGDYLLEVRSYK